MTALASLYEGIASCHGCALSQHRTRVVPGEGPENAEVLFIGEAPGWHEDQQGRPFVGAAGAFLDELLSSIDLKRNEVYIANVIKCRPPGNRDPLPVEIQACRRWLDRQIEIICPRVIVTLGRFSLARYFPGESIGRVHGKERREGSIIYYPMYHPAAALHRGSLRNVIEEDMLRIPQILTRTEKVSAVQQEEPQQLSMW